jgi:hypothetical protein
MPEERDKKITKWQQTPRDQWLSSVESGSRQVIKERLGPQIITGRSPTGSFSPCDGDVYTLFFLFLKGTWFPITGGSQ